MLFLVPKMWKRDLRVIFNLQSFESEKRNYYMKDIAISISFVMVGATCEGKTRMIISVMKFLKPMRN